MSEEVTGYCVFLTMRSVITTSSEVEPLAGQDISLVNFINHAVNTPLSPFLDGFKLHSREMS